MGLGRKLVSSTHGMMPNNAGNISLTRRAGDPLEARAILKTIGASEKRASDLYVGSVKTNIGHLEGAAGVAGIIKAALTVERGVIPQNLWCVPRSELGLGVS